MKTYLLVPFLAFGLSACVTVSRPAPTAPSEPTTPAVSTPNPTTSLRVEQAARQFVRVVRTVEPVAEAECRARTTNMNCDFNIVVDDRPGHPPNAFQTRDKEGRPILAFNIPLIATVRNADELAFVMGHEAAHHIRAHLDRQQRNATAGALIFGGIAAITGAGALASGGLSAADTADSDEVTIDIGPFGRIEGGEDGAVAAFRNEDGEEATITVNNEEE